MDDLDFSVQLAPYSFGRPIERPIFILSLDGGGIRGRREAEILAALERETLSEFGLHLCRIFDIMAGTSTGAGIVAALSLPGSTPHIPAFTAERLRALYTSHNAKKIFHAPLGYRIRTLGGLRGPRFPSTGLSHVLREYFKDHWISEAMTNILIPAFSLDTGREKYFRSDRAQQHLSEDYFVFDAVKASASAPTYFPAHAAINGEGLETLCVDGGLCMNNPTAEAFRMAEELYPGSEKYVLSLGTGEKAPHGNTKALHAEGLIRAARAIINATMSGSSRHVDDEMHRLLPTPSAGYPGHQHYFRSQSTITGSLTDMASTDPHVIAAIARLGDPGHNPEVRTTIESFMNVLRPFYNRAHTAPHME